MKDWLAQLASRERRGLLVGVGLLLAVLLYLLAWLPFSREVERLRTTVAEQRALAAWMEQAAREAQRLRRLRAASSQGRAHRSLLSLSDQTARQRGLGGAIKRVEPEGQDKVRIRLEAAAFDDLVRWLEQLQLGHGVRILRITVEARETPGLVDARLTLAEGAS